ncbi:hypothetical protein C5167_040799 [Papaver somniferum]|uniref:Uncharacterized protein n=1 Tax=Papaver somniferum TaxID=3469 RepID=A0A4Y7IIE7_PAPSO|nr:hypothetical protein C5167_040799 [Papaver somniferum]
MLVELFLAQNDYPKVGASTQFQDGDAWLVQMLFSKLIRDNKSSNHSNKDQVVCCRAFRWA